MNRVVDVRGLLCPEPLVMTKRAIKMARLSDTIEVLLDNDTSRCNVEAFLDELGFAHDGNWDGEVFRIVFSVNQSLPFRARSVVEDSCIPPVAQFKSKGYVIVLRSDVMGGADEDLGRLLMRACVNSLTELDSLPEFVILYNGGVKLALAATDTAHSLLQLTDQGVQVVVCGTCVDFFGIKDQLALGTISNMYNINTILSEAHHVVYP